jgi:hypothetical protein
VRCQTHLMTVRRDDHLLPGLPGSRTVESLPNVLQGMLQAVASLDIAPITPKQAGQLVALASSARCF